MQALFGTFSGIDHLLAQHIAHLFIRDPISLFSEKIHQNDECDTDHFEVSLQYIFYAYLPYQSGTVLLLVTNPSYYK